LWDGLRQGVIDLVVTDHSPSPPEMKKLAEGDFRKAWGGIASFSAALPVMWTEASKRGFELTDIAKWMGEGPAKLAGVAGSKGRIAAGMDADFVVFDSENKFVLKEEHLRYRHKVSPYLGKPLRGIVRETYLRGECVFAGGGFPGEPRGKEFQM
jgi:allantoinase